MPYLQRMHVRAILMFRGHVPQLAGDIHARILANLATPYLGLPW